MVFFLIIKYVDKPRYCIVRASYIVHCMLRIASSSSIIFAGVTNMAAIQVMERVHGQLSSFWKRYTNELHMSL